VARREACLDPGLAFAEPVERPIQLVLAGVPDAEQIAQGRRAEPAGGGELGRRRNQAGDEHADDEVARPAPARLDQALDAEAAQRAEDRRDMAVGHAPPDLHP